ncbi:MAG: CoA-binding protein [Candidatus Micrarchaeota archaeon]|nr:CoA-binding protein [Candidatus Micrarchaeota archaeon]
MSKEVKSCPAHAGGKYADHETIRAILSMKKVAVVGLSDNPERPSFNVAKYLSEQGYEIIPVNPMIAEWQGKRSFPDLLSIKGQIEVVDIFRKSEAVPEIVSQAILAGAKAIWMQEGVANEEAARKAREAGLLVVMDRCMKKEHQKLSSGDARL